MAGRFSSDVELARPRFPLRCIFLSTRKTSLHVKITGRRERSRGESRREVSYCRTWQHTQTRRARKKQLPWKRPSETQSATPSPEADSILRKFRPEYSPLSDVWKPPVFSSTGRSPSVRTLKVLLASRLRVYAAQLILASVPQKFRSQENDRQVWAIGCRGKAQTTSTNARGSIQRKAGAAPGSQRV